MTSSSLERTSLGSRPDLPNLNCQSRVWFLNFLIVAQVSTECSREKVLAVSPSGRMFYPSTRQGDMCAPVSAECKTFSINSCQPTSEPRQKIGSLLSRMARSGKQFLGKLRSCQHSSPGDEGTAQYLCSLQIRFHPARGHIKNFPP